MDIWYKGDIIGQSQEELKSGDTLVLNGVHYKVMFIDCLDEVGAYVTEV